jgi:hypothetical protein
MRPNSGVPSRLLSVYGGQLYALDGQRLVGVAVMSARIEEGSIGQLGCAVEIRLIGRVLELVTP